MERIANNFFLAIVVFLSLSLAVLSLPRLVSAITVIYPNAVHESLLYSETPANELMLKAKVKTEDALSWNDNSNYWLQIGNFLQTLIWSDEYSKDEYLAMNVVADKANQACLKLSVVEPYVWYRLAINRFIVNENDVEIINLLKFSIYTGRMEPNLLILRLYFLSKYIDYFDKEMVGLVEDQIRLAWLLKTHQLLDTVISIPTLRPLVYDALDSDELLIFNKRFEKTIQKNNR